MRRKNKNLITCVLILFIVVLVVLAFLIFTKINSKDKDEQTKAEDTTSTATVEVKEDYEEQEQNKETGAQVEINDIIVDDNEKTGLYYGIDVSKHQGTIDWKAVADAGVDYAIIRVGYRTQISGEIVEDECAKYNLQEATKNGIMVGAYFFSTAVTDAEAVEEADFVANIIDGYSITYPVVYNCEGFEYEDDRQYGISVDDRTGFAIAFLEEIENKGYTGMFYASKSAMDNNNLWNMDQINESYKVWVSHYPATFTSDMESQYKDEFAMWQYTDNGSIAGIDSAVDMDIAYFSYSETSKPVSGNVENVTANDEANDVSNDNFTEVNESVTAKEYVNLRSSTSQADDTNVVDVLNNGTVVTRTGISDSGWSRLNYNGQTVYAVSSYLTTDLNAEQETETQFKTQFKEVSDTVTAKELTNLRDIPSTFEPSKVIYELKKGETVERTGISEEYGWSRVIYNGQTLYAVTSYLEVVTE